jgi:predicted SAM-dependent methyltransferase
VKINLGCGHKKLDGYINIDADESCRPDICADACLLSWIPDCLVEEIRMDAVFEHIYKSERAGAIKEWFRLLTSGGKLVINWIPDFEMAIGLYGGPGPTPEFPVFDIEMCSRLVNGLVTDCDDLQLHKDIFSKEKVRREIKAAGFVDVEVFNALYPGENPDILFNICVTARKP